MIKAAKDKAHQLHYNRDPRNSIDPEMIKLPSYYNHHEKKLMRKHMRAVYDKFNKPEKYVQDEFGEYIQFLKSIT
jgi:hypothetical protein